MVSLRSNFPAIKRALGPAGKALIVVCAAFLALHLAGAAIDVWAHRANQNRGSLPAYVAELRAGRTFDLAQAMREIHLGTIHSDRRRLALTENWLQWSLGKIHPPLACTQDTSRLIAGHIANCSERSQILKTLAEEAGYECRFVGLSGHVVLEVRTPQGWSLADPDYGVVYPVGIAELQEASGETIVRDTLSTAGYPPLTIGRYWEIVHSAADNVVLPVGSAISPRVYAVERACDWLAPLLPLAGLALGVVLLRVGRSKVSSPAIVGAAALPHLTAIPVRET